MWDSLLNILGSVINKLIVAIQVWLMLLLIHTSSHHTLCCLIVSRTACVNLLRTKKTLLITMSGVGLSDWRFITWWYIYHRGRISSF